MHAIRVHQTGGADAMRLEDVQVREPQEHEVRVRVEAAGVNYIDVYHRTGLYPQPLPFGLGLEGAGVIEALGPNTAPYKVGDRVAWTRVPGSYATHVVADVSKLVPIPAAITTEIAAAAMLQGLTVHFLTRSTFPLAKGDVCLVHAAAGGVGLLLCQLAKRAGAQAIGTVSTREKAELAKRAGAEHTILYTERDFAEAVLEITGGKKCAVVYDSVGKTTFMKSLDCLRPRGMMVSFGQSSGTVPPLEIKILNDKGSLFLTRPSMMHHVEKREEFEMRAKELFAWIESGLEIRIHARLPLAEAPRAHQMLESRETSGKLLLIP